MSEILLDNVKKNKNILIDEEEIKTIFDMADYMVIYF
jgi:hypothetical protein